MKPAEEKLETVELHEYRLRARAWLQDNVLRIEKRHLPIDAEASVARLDEFRDLQRRLFEAGYSGFTFPLEYGGQGQTLEHERVFEEEATDYELPPVSFGVSINIIGATILEFGTEDQKRTHIPDILSGERLWTQLLSEPSGGSDLAGLITDAARDGDAFVVNGQKTWTSNGHLSDMALCPACTRWDVPKHRGISMLIVDLNSPGIELRRIPQIDGGAEFCEEFFTDVVVPASNLLGEENDGWQVARGMLEIEHAWVGRGGAEVAQQEGVFPALVELVKARGLERDQGLRRRVADLHVSQVVQKVLSRRISNAMNAGDLPQAYGGILKLGDDLLGQRQAEVATELAGVLGVVWPADGPDPGRWADLFLDSRRLTIAGGTAEMQRNNVSERVLGLPREPAADRDIPFHEVPHN